MTKDEWDIVRKRLLVIPGNVVRLSIDGYNVALQSGYESINSMKINIAVYIDGKMSMEHLKPESEICKRFMCPVTKCFLPQKEIKKASKSKKIQKELKERYTSTYYIPYWSSFNRLKSHFIKNNTSIELEDKGCKVSDI